METPRTQHQFDLLVPDEEAARRMLAAIRWPEGVACNSCGSKDVIGMKTRPQWWHCRVCKAQTSVRSGTVLHRTRKPLRDWLYAIWQMSLPSGISARKLQRDLHYGRYETAWVMLHKLRASLEERNDRKLERGVVRVGIAWLDIERHARGDRLDRWPAHLAIAAEEIRGPAPGSIRMDRLPEMVVWKVPGTPASDDWLSTICERRILSPGPTILLDARLPSPISMPGRPLSLEYHWGQLASWIRRRLGGVSRKYLPNYLAQFVYEQNRCTPTARLFERMIRRTVQEPFTPRSAMALAG